MPTYEYACTACANEWEEIQKISEDPLDTCPKCGQKTAKRQISGGNFILKGGGWYSDLYSSPKPKSSDKKDGDSASTSKSEGSSKDGGSKDSGSKDSGSKESSTKESSAPKESASKSSGGGSGSGSTSK